MTTQTLSPQMPAAAGGSDSLRDDRAAIDKAISLLVCFGAEATSGVGVSELARRADLSKSTAFRVLGHLERNGVVEKVGRKYRLGERLHDLGQHVYAPDNDRVRDLLTPFVTDLYEATHATVHLAALHGTDVVYLAKLHGHRPVPCPSRVGGRVPAHCTGLGKALLAYDAEAQDLVLRAGLRPFTSSTVQDPDQFLAQLAAVRRDGIAHDDEEVRPGLVCVAAPVLGRAGRPVAALSVSVAAGRADMAAVESALRRVAAGATRMMTRSESLRGLKTA